MFILIVNIKCQILMTRMKNIDHSNKLLVTDKSIFKALLYTIGILATASLTGRYLIYYTKVDSRTLNDMIRAFNLDAENNIPTFFSTFLFLFASCLLYLNFKVDVEKNRFWLFLSALFLFLSIDEANQIHEKLNYIKFKLEFLSSSKLLYMWVFPYLIFTVILAIVLKKFIFSLPKRTRFLFVLSAIIFTTGAIGFEVIHDYLLAINHRIESFSLELLVLFEELFELVGLAIFVYANLEYLGTKNCSIRVIVRK